MLYKKKREDTIALTSHVILKFILNISDAHIRVPATTERHTIVDCSIKIVNHETEINEGSFSILL